MKTRENLQNNSFKLGDKIFHLYGYGCGMVLEVDVGCEIVRVLWDDPSLSQWEDELPRETFWTNLDQIILLEKYNVEENNQ